MNLISIKTVLCATFVWVLLCSAVSAGDFDADAWDGDGEEVEPVGGAGAWADGPVKKGQLEEPFPPPAPAGVALPLKRAVAPDAVPDSPGDTVFIAVTVVCSAGAVVGLVGAAALWYRLHRRYKAAEEAEYGGGPQYGVTGPAALRGSPAGDAKLASSAHLYHYQHTKQQIISMENNEDGKGHESEDSEAEGEEADYSVYECPGLAPTGDIEVSNPLFESGSPVPSPPTSAKPHDS